MKLTSDLHVVGGGYFGFGLSGHLDLKSLDFTFHCTIFFLPVVIGLGVSSLLRVWMLDQRVGIFNKNLLELSLLYRMMLRLVEPASQSRAIQCRAYVRSGSRLVRSDWQARLP